MILKLPIAAPRHVTSSGTVSDLTLMQGDTFGATVTIYQPDGTTPLNLTGFVVNAQIRRGPADQYTEIAAVINLVISDPAAGTIALSLGPTVTALLTGQYQWDLQLISPGGIVTTVLRGKVTMVAEVTRV
jgi:hypothetical protein